MIEWGDEGKGGGEVWISGDIRRDLSRLGLCVVLMMVMSRSLTKTALWNVINLVEGRESDAVIEWGVGMVLKGKGGGEVGRNGEISRDRSRLGLCTALIMVINL